jgi:hypothetical protein
LLGGCRGQLADTSAWVPLLMAVAGAPDCGVQDRLATLMQPLVSPGHNKATHGPKKKNVGDKQ